jgi:hypothetical protein
LGAREFHLQPSAFPAGISRSAVRDANPIESFRTKSGSAALTSVNFTRVADIAAMAAAIGRLLTHVMPLSS